MTSFDDIDKDPFLSDDYDSATGEFVRPQKKRKKLNSNGGVGGKEIEEEIVPSTPISRISDFLAKFTYDESKDGAEVIDAKKAEREKYISWVNDMLNEPTPDAMRDDDLDVEKNTDDTKALVIHKPTGFQFDAVGRDSESAVFTAKMKVKEIVWNHLNDWRDSPLEFRKFHGVTSERQPGPVT